MTDAHKAAERPEDITRLIVEYVNAGDAEGAAGLYASDAVMAFPPGEVTEGRDAIRAVYERIIEQGVRFQPESPLTTLRLGDVARTATAAGDEAGARAQVAQRQPDGSWLRILDRPDFRG